MNPRVEFDLKKLEQNVLNLKTETKNIMFLFPVKCCTHSSILDLFFNNGFGFDVSNKNEMNKIQKYLDGRFISASGPLSYELENNNYSNLHIIANNLLRLDEQKGLRINFNSSSNFDKSRFGVDYTTINDELANQIKYIHFHNSDYRDIAKCKNICNEFNNVLKTFNSLEYINIGGHLEDLSFEEGIQYLNNIRKVIPESIKLIVELGDFLFKNVGKLYCKVIDAKYDGNKQLITLNFSKIANQRWVYPEYYSLSNEKELIATFFYGSSCCETDLYAEVKSQKLEINDEVIFSNISPYSYEWDTSFNGIEKIKFLFNK